MLTHIDIRDFAIIERLELDLAAGMTAITGETGAGKSIMLDAIGLVLGDRAEAAMVRHGARRADISVTLDISSPEVLAWLEQNDLDAGEECVLRSLEIDKNVTNYYRYNGSLTTPPCSEGVIWIVKRDRVTVSKPQVAALVKVLGHPNNRPLQPSNARLVIE